MPLVTRSSFDAVIKCLSTASALAVDVESTGLRPYHGDRLFSVIISDGQESYYFNFGTAADVPLDAFLVTTHKERLRWLLGQDRTYYLHNFKFDAAMLEQHGIKLGGRVHDSMVIARVLDSTLLPGQMSLDACATKIGYPKDDSVKKWLDVTGSYTRDTSKKPAKKNYHYNLVPLPIIQKYAERDAEITFKLGGWQLDRLAKLDAEIMAAVPAAARITQVYENECQLVKTVYDMERRGVLVDRGYCRKAITRCTMDMVMAAENFKGHAGEPFKDSAKVYRRVFSREEAKWGRGKLTATGKSNPKFDAAVLQKFEHPAARWVLAYKDAKSDANFFQGFMHAADADGVIHTNFNQHATATGRFSSSNPNLQNLTKVEGDELNAEFVVRRAIVPRPGYFFAMFDMSQAEYRLMLDYAAKLAFDDSGVMALIKNILGGLDVHSATGELAKISRRDAKTVNFALLYGSGITSLASRLGVSRAVASGLRDSIFRAAPEIATFIKRATTTAERRGYVVNWFGRRCDFPDPRFAYRACNYLIQGGVADCVKIGMNRLATYLQDKQSKLVLNIHDEAVVECHLSEQHILPEIKTLLEGVYPHKFLPLTWDVSHSFRSLADRIEGYPINT